MEIVVCPAHNREYCGYCPTCKEPYCSECQTHLQHKELHIFHVINKENLLKEIRIEEAIIENTEASIQEYKDSINIVLNRINLAKREIIEWSREFKLKLDELVHEYIKQMEDEVYVLVQRMVTVINEFREVRQQSMYYLKSFKELMDSCESNYNRSTTEAYLAVKKFNALNASLKKRDALSDIERIKGKFLFVLSQIFKEKIDNTFDTLKIVFQQASGLFDKIKSPDKKENNGEVNH